MNKYPNRGESEQVVELQDYVFQFICLVEPELDAGGSLREFMPQSKYRNISNNRLNAYGNGPFCRFRIPSEFDRAGAYAVYVNEDLTYIGECENLSKRWNVGYGNISPRKCFVGGQSTNCRLNNLILNACKSGSKIKLFLHKTDDRFNVEDILIEKYNPPWNIEKSNRKHIQSLRNTLGSRKKTRTRNSYGKLEDYLRDSQKQIENLTYNQIEKILGTKLPQSAYLYRAWWANSGHSHSRAWSDANWKVLAVKLGVFVTLKKDK